MALLRRHRVQAARLLIVGDQKRIAPEASVEWLRIDDPRFLCRGVPSRCDDRQGSLFRYVPDNSTPSMGCLGAWRVFRSGHAALNSAARDAEGDCKKSRALVIAPLRAQHVLYGFDFCGRRAPTFAISPSCCGARDVIGLLVRAKSDLLRFIDRFPEAIPLLAQCSRRHSKASWDSARNPPIGLARAAAG